MNDIHIFHDYHVLIGLLYSLSG